MKLRFVWLLVLAGLLQAHVGSPDVYLDAQAGPYKLFITVRPPAVVPGVAELEVRTESTGVREIRAVPIPLANTGAELTPVADTLKKSTQDPQFFTGSLWMMVTGSWQIRINVEGAQGSGVIAVPVPSVAMTTKPMQTGLAAILFCLLCLLMAGLVLMVGASVREAKLPAGVKPGPADRRHARLAMAITFVVVFCIVAFGHQWWKESEANSRLKIYKPLQMAATMSQPGVLTLRMSNPAWMRPPLRRNGSPASTPFFTRVMDDLVPDHEHLMHLYAIRQPGMEVVYHLHPDLTEPGLFQLQLPVMQPGTYRLYGDVVHANGFAETMVSTIEIPAGTPGRPLSGDDAEGIWFPWNTVGERNRFTLSDGYVMEWMRPAGVLHAKVGIPFRFRLLDSKGNPATEMQFYMGMLGHAAFVKTDGTTFAHIHPIGSVPMASFMLAQNRTSRQSLQTAGVSASGMAMPDMEMDPASSRSSLPNEVMFPYGFPAGGHYRIFVQMKRAGIIETGIFDATVQ